MSKETRWVDVRWQDVGSFSLVVYISVISRDLDPCNENIQGWEDLIMSHCQAIKAFSVKSRYIGH